MKILFLVRLYKPHVGGVEKQVESLCRKLRKRNYQIIILTEKYDDSLSDMEYIDGVKVVRIGYPIKRYFGLISIWLWIFKHRDLIKNADIVHAHSILVWYWPFRLLFPRKPVYVTFHGWEGIYPIPLKNILIRKVDAWIAWKNITISDYVEKYYHIKADELSYTAVNIPKRSTFKKDKKKLLYVGRLDKDTGLKKILKALSYVKGYNVDFCGDGPLHKECESYGKVHGFVNPNPFYERATICLSPGHTSILEAFTYKCLIVTTYNNPVKKDYLIMTPFSKWIIVKNKPKDFATAIDYYLKNPKKARIRIEQAYNWVLTQNWDTETEKYLDLWGVKD